MHTTILHSPLSAASRDFLATLGVAIPDGQDVTVTVDGQAVRVVSDHDLAVGVYPTISGYPAVVVDEAGAIRVLIGPADWSAVRDWLANPGGGNAAAVPRSTRMSRYQFSQRLTPAERIAIREAGRSDPEVADFWDLFTLAEEIDLEDANMIAGIHLLASKGLITLSRISEVLTP